MISRTILGYLVALFFLAQFFVSLPSIAQFVAPLTQNLNRSYDDKMRAHWGEYYELIQFIRKETPNDAVLLMDSSSRINLDLYFLYPRRIFYDRGMIVRGKSVDYYVMTGDVPPSAIEGKRIMLDDRRGLIHLK